MTYKKSVMKNSSDNVSEYVNFNSITVSGSVPALHNELSGYSLISHTHDQYFLNSLSGSFSLTGHTHAQYALSTDLTDVENSLSGYSQTNHTHDQYFLNSLSGSFSLSGHNHDGTYVPVSHLSDLDPHSQYLLKSVSGDFALQSDLVSLSAYAYSISGGTISSTSAYFETFTDSDLVSGILTVTHNQGSQYGCSVNVVDEFDEYVLPDKITFTDDNNLSVDLSNYTPLSGTWKISVAKHYGGTGTSFDGNLLTGYVTDSELSNLSGSFSLSGHSHAVGTQCCRLSISSTNPVQMDELTDQTSIYLHPYKGNMMILWNGTSWQSVSFTSVLQISLSLLQSSTNYDVFAYLNSGTVACELTAWTDDTTRASAVSYQDGFLCKTSDKTRLLVGTIRTSPSNGSAQSFTPYSSFTGRTTLWYDNIVSRDSGSTSYTDVATGGETFYIKFDLGSAKTINRIIMYGFSDYYSGKAPYSRTAYYESSDDNSNWTTITSYSITIGSTTGNDVDKTFTDTTARYFRVRIIMVATDRYYLDEAKIYSASVSRVDWKTIGLKSIGNVYNTIPISVKTENTNSSWSYTTNAWREYNSGIGQTRGEFVSTMQNICVSEFDYSSSTYNTIVFQYDTANGSTNRLSYKAHDASNNFTSTGSKCSIFSEGYHYITQSEYGRTSGTTSGLGSGGEIVVML